MTTDPTHRYQAVLADSGMPCGPAFVCSSTEDAIATCQILSNALQRPLNLRRVSSSGLLQWPYCNATVASVTPTNGTPCGTSRTVSY